MGSCVICTTNVSLVSGSMVDGEGADLVDKLLDPGKDLGVDRVR